MSLFPQSLHRRLGIVFLVSAVFLFIGGMVLTGSNSPSSGSLLCWMGCFVSTCLAMLMALLDLRAIRKSWIEQHKDLLRTSLSEILAARKDEEKGATHEESESGG